MKGVGYFLGATLGAALGAALLFFLISIIFLRPRKISNFEITKFIENSDKILIKEVPLKEGGFYLGLLQDAYKGVTNFLLKGQTDDLMKALQNEEASARAKITVLAGKD